MKISIALCTYNGEKFLSEQLESFIKQSRLPDELIICDDLSKDATIEIIEDFATKAPFEVKLFRNEKNLGSTKNFEKAISLCTGDVIFLSDQDDLWFPEKIEKIEQVFQENSDVGLVFSNAEIIDEKGKTLHQNLLSLTFGKEERQRDFFETLVRQNVITGAAMAFRSEFRKDFMPIPNDLVMIHDGWISLVIASKSKVYLLDENLIKYRKHENQQIGVDYKTGNENRQAEFSASIEQRKLYLKNMEKMLGIFPKFPIFQARIDEITQIIKDALIEKQQLLDHHTARLNLPKNKLKRISPIFRELKTKRYHTFSNGVKSAIKDLFETW
jgi:glycosyltransferase involved in cell wall biosynthesis